MAHDQEMVKQLQRHLRDWNPEGRCKRHYKAKQCCEYDEQGRLITLHLCELELAQVPSEVWQFVALQRLQLEHNQTSTLPAEVGNLMSLDTFNLGFNQIHTLSAELWMLTPLRSLDLHLNEISTLPAEVGNLTSLQTLDLGDNRFSWLPAEVEHLTSLQQLSLRGNQLSALPAGLWKLPSLRVLSLSDNRFSTLPAEVGNLTSLHQLYLGGNQLSTLPAEMGNLSSLGTLHLGQNPLKTPPPEIIAQGIPAILLYLRRLQQADVEHFEVQVTLVGEGDISLPGSTKAISSDETSREKRRANTKEALPVKIFYCYAHKDKDLRDRIDKHLGVLKRLGHVVGWYDREIQAGTEWEREIEGNLSSANLILLLVSADFVSSDYCYGVEMKKALELHRAGQARVLPILLRPVDWQDAPFATLQMLPTGAIPIMKWKDQDEALEDVAKGIRTVVSSLRAQRG